MMSPKRNCVQIVLRWEADDPVSNVIWLGGGCFGTLIVPAALNGRTVDVVTELDGNLEGRSYTAELTNPSDFDNVSLLSVPKSITTGANALSADEIREIGAVGHVRFVLDTAPVADCEAVLWWKD